MLDDYYRLMGWDAMGIPTDETLSALGLPDIIDEMAKRRKA